MMTLYKDFAMATDNAISYWEALLSKEAFFLVLDNMKQKIVIRVSMDCSKCRAKALKIAAVAEGVTSVALHGPQKDKLMIQGEGIDAACLTSCLRKKLCHAVLETIEEVKDKKDPDKDKKCPTICCCQPHAKCYCCQPQVECYRVVPDPSPAPCTIM